jgi:hypothetical protein
MVNDPASQHDNNCESRVGGKSIKYDDDGYAQDIEGQALKHYHERRQPANERERELYEGFAIEDTQRVIQRGISSLR